MIAVVLVAVLLAFVVGGVLGFRWGANSVGAMLKRLPKERRAQIGEWLDEETHNRVLGLDKL